VFLTQHLSCLSVFESPVVETLEDQDVWETIAAVDDKEDLDSDGSEYESDLSEEIQLVESHKKRILSN
jgi:hypothetical protein